MFRLRSKIVLGITLIIVINTLLMVLIINYTTRLGYETFTKQKDIDFCRNLVKPLSTFYSNQKNWENVAEFIGQFSDGETSSYTSLILTDQKGMILFDSIEDSYDGEYEDMDQDYDGEYKDMDQDYDGEYEDMDDESFEDYKDIDDESGSEYKDMDDESFEDYKDMDDDSFEDYKDIDDESGVKYEDMDDESGSEYKDMDQDYDGEYEDMDDDSFEDYKDMDDESYEDYKDMDDESYEDYKDISGNSSKKNIGGNSIIPNVFEKNSVDDLGGLELDPEVGVPILHNNEVVGYLYAGSMIKSGLTEEENLFLNQIKTIIILVSIVILIVSIIFAFYFSWRISKPISELSIGVKNIELGNYGSRVNTNGADEIADLSHSFNKMAESLEENETWRKQIIADSAHELRTPISLIQGNLEMILDGVYEPDLDHIKKIYDETLVLSKLIKELQVLSSAESGSMILNMEELDLNNLINNTVEIYKVKAKNENINLVNSVKSSLPIINGDYHKLKQVLSNILNNAFRHTPAGGYIKVYGETKGNLVTIKIQDSGVGIPNEDIEKIFERFYRTDSSRNRKLGGSGLGLAISREIIKLHGGVIYAEPTDKKGAIIVITLPFNV